MTPTRDRFSYIPDMLTDKAPQILYATQHEDVRKTPANQEAAVCRDFAVFINTAITPWQQHAYPPITTHALRT